MTGKVSGLGITTSETLLQGTFSNFVANQTGTVTLGIGSDSKSPDLLAAIGLPSDTPFNFFELTLTYDAEKGTYTGAEVINTTAPEPSSWLLLGSGLVGMGLLVRRKVQQVKA